MKIIVLAAGKSKRFKSNKHKALHDLLGKTILERILDCLWSLNPSQIHLVLGHQMDEIAGRLKRGETYVEQKEQLGTADALRVGLKGLSVTADEDGGLLVTCADTPLLKAATLNDLIQTVRQNDAQLGVLTAILEEPYGYGRVIRQGQQVRKIVEEKDASSAQKELKEINAGVYFINLPQLQLQELLSGITNQNQQSEFYLTDLVERADSRGLKVVAHQVADCAEIVGVNTKADLTQVIDLMSQKKIEDLQDQGVMFINPASCSVSPEVKIEPDAVIWPGCHLLGDISIGEGSQIGPNCFILNSSIGRHCTVKYSCVTDSQLADECSVGPFANLRPGSQLMKGACVGDFVELKNSVLGCNSKVPHLSYIGDSVLGKDVNIGAGSITANYDAISGEKNQTKLGDSVKVGSNSVLVAPVQIANGCMVAAGSVITETVNVPNSLILARTPQTVKEGWVNIKRKELNPEKSLEELMESS